MRITCTIGPLMALNEFIKHTACGACGSSDARAMYLDGHEWCFSCGDFKPPPLKTRVESTFQPKPTQKTPYEIGLPYDATSNLPPFVTQWLRKYGITDDEAAANNFKWTSCRQLLIMPVFSDTELLMWQGRNFDLVNKVPKYITYGKPADILHIISNKKEEECDVIVLTEDLLSAIKVGRQFPAMPLWGSYMSLTSMVRLAHRTKRVIFWLDADKRQAAAGLSARASQFFQNSSIIYTEKDPKEYNDDQIYLEVSKGLMA